MKKFMIAAAIVCVAALSQAAQFNWRTANVKDITGLANYSGSATLYLTDVTAGKNYTYNGVMANGVIQQLVGSDQGEIIQGNSYSAYYTMTDLEGNIFTSTTKTGLTATAPSNAPIQFGNGGTWESVPEPTSGLLLLLGVAGLALRRRRA